MHSAASPSAFRRPSIVSSRHFFQRAHASDGARRRGRGETARRGDQAARRERGRKDHGARGDRLRRDTRAAPSFLSAIPVVERHLLLFQRAALSFVVRPSQLDAGEVRGAVRGRPLREHLRGAGRNPSSCEEEESHPLRWGDAPAGRARPRRRRPPARVMSEIRGWMDGKFLRSSIASLVVYVVASLIRDLTAAGNSSPACKR